MVGGLGVAASLWSSLVGTLLVPGKSPGAARSPRRDVWICLYAYLCKTADYKITLWLRLAQERMLMVTARLRTSSS